MGSRRYYKKGDVFLSACVLDTFVYVVVEEPSCGVAKHMKINVFKGEAVTACVNATVAILSHESYLGNAFGSLPSRKR